MATTEPGRAQPDGGKIRLDGDRLARRLFAGVTATLVGLVVLDYVFEVRRVIPHLAIRRLFNCAREGSIPSWFSVTLLLCAAASLLAIFLVGGVRGERRRTRGGWLLIALFFAFMAVDDAAQIHERIGAWLGDRLRGDTGVRVTWVRAILDSDAYSWQIFLGPFFVAMGIFMLTFLWGHLGRHGLRRYLVLGLGCYAVAVGLDALERVEGVFDGLAQDWGWRASAVRHFAKVLEESLEMLGTAGFWIGFLRYLAHEADGLWFGVCPSSRD